MNTNPRTIAALTLFLMVAVLHILGLLFRPDLAFYSKPFLMITLGFYYATAATRINVWFIAALFFSFGGDVLLLDKDNYFIFGLASFLLAHLMYIKLNAGFLSGMNRPNILWSSLPFVLILFGLMSLFYNNLESMLIPVLVYGITISSFGAITFAVYRENKSTENLWLLVGALLFILSDSLIAFNKFYKANELYPIVIMVTYILAQFLICKSFISKSHAEVKS